MKFDWQKILSEAAKSIGTFPQEVIQILRAPQADPRITVLVLSILVVGLLLLVMFGVMLWPLFKRRPIAEEVKEAPVEAPLFPLETPVAIRKRGIDWVTVGIFVLIIVALMATASVYVSQPSFCLNCHIVRKEYKSWIKSSHRNIGCLACHQNPGAVGYVVQKASYVREALLFITNNYTEPLQSMVSNSACNRCHRTVGSVTVTRYGIRVRHRDFLQEGYRCTGCHNTVAHGDKVPFPKFPTMDKCVVCHDNKRASADCKLCHVQEIKEAREPRRELVKVATEIPWHCRGCHSPKLSQKCIDCHGLEMPHSPEFLAGKHARLAFTQKSICLKCHIGLRLCNKCHAYPSPHGPEKEWIRLHGPAAKKSIIVQVFLEDSQFVDCYICHDRSPNMCDACHVGQKEVRMEELYPKKPKVEEKRQEPSAQPLPEE